MADNLKLPSRNYWEGFKARNEALWDKVKNNTFANMVFPVKEVSEGNTEAILPLVVPGGNAAALTVKTVFNPRSLLLKKGSDRLIDKAWESVLRDRLGKSLADRMVEAMNLEGANGAYAELVLFEPEMGSPLLKFIPKRLKKAAAKVGDEFVVTDNKVYQNIGRNRGDHVTPYWVEVPEEVLLRKASKHSAYKPAPNNTILQPIEWELLPFKSGGKLNYTKFFK